MAVRCKINCRQYFAFLINGEKACEMDFQYFFGVCFLKKMYLSKKYVVCLFVYFSQNWRVKEKISL